MTDLIRFPSAWRGLGPEHMYENREGAERMARWWLKHLGDVLIVHERTPEGFYWLDIEPFSPDRRCPSTALILLS